METQFFNCSQCGAINPVQKNGGTGYAVDSQNNKICYDCCAINDSNDLDNLKPKEKLCLYWDGKQVMNWPGTLRINPLRATEGKHNIAGKRETIYFRHHGKNFIGVNYGSNSQILHIKTIK